MTREITTEDKQVVRVPPVKMPKPCLSCELGEHEACAQLFCNCTVCDPL